MTDNNRSVSFKTFEAVEALLRKKESVDETKEEKREEKVCTVYLH